jgi:hypothetical protein
VSVVSAEPELVRPREALVSLARTLSVAPSPARSVDSSLVECSVVSAFGCSPSVADAQGSLTDNQRP